MAKLILEANIDRADEAYSAILNAHEGLTEAQSHAFNARLVLILANHIGDLDVIQEALEAGRSSPGERAREADEGP